MLPGAKKPALILIASAVAFALMPVCFAGEKKTDDNYSEMYDEDSRLHIKNFHKYGYQNGADRHHRHDREYRRKDAYYGRYGYENRHRPQYRQSRRYYTPYRHYPQSGVGIQLYKSLD